MNEELYNHLIAIARDGGYTRYGQIAPMLGLDMANPADREQISVLLDEISTHENKNNRPLLSAVVIHQQDNIPGNGFFELAQRLQVFDGGDRLRFFIEELRRVHDFWRKN